MSGFRTSESQLTKRPVIEHPVPNVYVVQNRFQTGLERLKHLKRLKSRQICPDFGQLFGRSKSGQMVTTRMFKIRT